MNRIKLSSGNIVAGVCILILLYALFQRPTAAVNGMKYRLINDTTAFLLKYTGSASTVKIPDSIKVESNTYIIKRIDRHAFSYNKSITSVQLPPTLKEIGSGAFYGCTSLSGINLDNVVEIGDYSFMGCTSLQQLTIKDNVEKIREKSFMACSQLKIKLECPEAQISDNAFEGCLSVDSTAMKQE